MFFNDALDLGISQINSKLLLSLIVADVGFSAVDVVVVVGDVSVVFPVKVGRTLTRFDRYNISQMDFYL